MAVVVLALASAAPNLRVEASRCPSLETSLLAALRLELASQMASREAVLRVELAHCEADTWRLEWLGLPSPPPRRTTMGLGTFSPSARIRAAALWAAETWTAPLAPSAEPLATTPSQVRHTLDVPLPTPSTSSPLILSVGLSAAGLASNDGVFNPMTGLRLEAAYSVLSWLEMGGALEGGALFEPFNHHQPWLWVCGHIAPSLELGPWGWRGALGPRVCVTGSRHLLRGRDRWASGAALGALARLAFPTGNAIDVALRFDLSAWKPDTFFQEAVRLSAASAPDDPNPGGLTWMGTIAVALELRFGTGAAAAP